MYFFLKCGVIRGNEREGERVKKEKARGSGDGEIKTNIKNGKMRLLPNVSSLRHELAHAS